MFEDRQIRDQLLKGTLPLLILATLREGELHGYLIARRIRERRRSTGSRRRARSRPPGAMARPGSAGATTA